MAIKNCLAVSILLILATGQCLGEIASQAPISPGKRGSPPKSFAAKVEQAAERLRIDRRLERMPEHRRKAWVEFVVGNMLFAVVHEMGHAVSSEMQLAILGREEDAADSFATIAGLQMMSEFSERALMDAARGWFLSARRDDKEGAMAIYYDNHGMNQQRAYQIVCFMVGSDPAKFAALAQATKLPANRVKSCSEDYAGAVWAWDTVLKPYRREPDQSKTKIEVTYGEGKGRLDLYARVFQELGFLEVIADMAADKFVWRSPFQMEMQTCGTANASWNAKTRHVRVCYELAAEFAQNYRDFGSNLKPVKMKPGVPLAGR